MGDSQIISDTYNVFFYLSDKVLHTKSMKTIPRTGDFIILRGEEFKVIKVTWDVFDDVRSKIKIELENGIQ